MEQWIQSIGPWAVFIGMMIEGEVALLLAGYAVHHGHLELLPTLLLATLGGTCTDSLYYWLGRKYGVKLLRSRRSLRPVRARAILLLRKHGHVMAFAVRFAFGLRIALPIAIGASRMRPRTFHTYNLLGSFTFAVFYLAMGYGVGRTIQGFIRRAGITELDAAIGLVVIGAIVWLVREWRLYRARPETTGDDPINPRS